MKKLAIMIAALLMTTVSALAWIHGIPSGGGGCSNALNFSQACNSQYFGIM